MNDTPHSIAIDGVGPMPLSRPDSVAVLAEVVRRCAAEGTAVYLVGGGTMLDYGLPPARPGLAVSTKKLDQVIDFPASDMTITVQAGITMARLQEITRAEGLTLPIDVPDPHRATLGGAIACNVSGPRRYGYGTFRDYVLGISLVNDRGEETKAGGRVVKNVAGYDLMKLYTGSLGTLGVITQVTLKLRPLPEERAIVVCSDNELDRLGDVLNRLHRSGTRPSGIEMGCTSGVTRDGQPKPTRAGYALFVMYEGSPESVTWQTEQVRRELPDTLHWNLTPSDRIDDSLSVMTAPKQTPEQGVIVRSTLRPSGVAEFCKQAFIAGLIDLTGSAGTGVLRGYPNPRIDNATAAAQLVRNVSDVAVTFDGNVVVERCPSAWKSSLPVWGRPPAALAMMKAVKRALDPKNIFNPGRFVTDM